MMGCVQGCPEGKDRHMQEEKEITLKIDEKAFTIVDEEGKRFIDSKEFELFIGMNAPDKRSCQLTGKTPINKVIKL